MVQIKVQKMHPLASLPFRGSEFAAGDDVIAVSRELQIESGAIYLEYDTGLAFEILGHQYYIESAPRSSLSNYDLILANSFGVIDWDYRGTVKYRFKVLLHAPKISDNFWYDGLGARVYNIGDKIGQLLLRPYIGREYFEVDKLNPTERNIGGFGSSGN